ncbi:MAG: membrane protein insertion efficiency factor YidD [Bacillota bacterium]
MRKLVIKLINWYQSISKHKNPTCRYRPTCSAYAKEAYQTRNFFVASWLSFYRILRCNPFSKGGYDPVPKKKTKTPGKHTIHYLHVPLKDNNDANVTLNTYLKRPLIVHFLVSSPTKDNTESKTEFIEHIKQIESSGYTLIIVYGHAINDHLINEPFSPVYCLKDGSRDLAKTFAVYDANNQYVKLSTFVINEHGQISQQFLDTSEENHVDVVMKTIIK